MAETARQQQSDLRTINADYEAKYGFRDPAEYFHKGAKGINHEVVEMISRMVEAGFRKIEATSFAHIGTRGRSFRSWRA